MFGKSCFTQQPLQFACCYKCGDKSNLAETSVGQKTLLSHLPVFGRFLDIITDRRNPKIPLCKSCMLGVWPLRAAMLILLALLILIASSLDRFFARDMGEYVLSIYVCGPLVVLAFYVFLRDWLLGVQIHQSGNGFRYVVARRFVAEFEVELRKQSSG